MENKINPLLFKIHPKFRLTLINVQDARVKAGKENTMDKVALWKLTKTISNMIESNKDVFKSLVEVEIDGNKN
jgi:hypothetical protein